MFHLFVYSQATHIACNVFAWNLLATCVITFIVVPVPFLNSKFLVTMYTCVLLIEKKVNFAQENYVGYENDGSVSITIVLDSLSSSDITITVSAIKGSADKKGECIYNR